MLRLCIKLLNQPILCNVEYLIKCTMMSGCSKRQKQKNKKQNLIQHILSSAKVSISETNELQQETHSSLYQY